MSDKQFQHYGKRYGYEDRRLATAIFEVFQEIEGDRSGIEPATEESELLKTQ
jgi:hypothetical protein